MIPQTKAKAPKQKAKASMGSWFLGIQRILQILVCSAVAAALTYTAYHISQGAIKRSRNATQICGRPIPINLSKHDEWPTPYTPSYDHQESGSRSKKEKEDGSFLLLKHDKPFGSHANAINGFFHALDVAYDENSKVYVTRDAHWVWDAILPLLYGGSPITSMKDTDWDFVSKILGVSVVPPNFEYDAKGTHINAEGAFYARGNRVQKDMIRNRRNTIWRNLFLHSGIWPAKLRHFDRKNLLDVCSLIAKAAKKQNAGPSQLKYSVVDVTWDTTKLPDLEKSTGRDLKAASDMSPEYVKDILQPLRLLESPVYITGGQKSNDKVQKLMNDPALKDNINFPQVKPVSDMDTRVIHFAIMADAFIGSPTSPRSLLIGKIRYALGMKNTYLFSRRVHTGYVDPLMNYYIDLYDEGHMGLLMG